MPVSNPLLPGLGMFGRHVDGRGPGRASGERDCRHRRHTRHSTALQIVNGRCLMRASPIAVDARRRLAGCMFPHHVGTNRRKCRRLHVNGT